MSDTPDRPSDLSRIFGEYLDRQQLGESPILEEYCQRFPNLAEQLRQHVRLYDALEELASSDVSPEEVYRSFPDLLPRVRERWQQIGCVPAELDAALPATDRFAQATSDDPPENSRLPEVQGYEVEGVLGRGGMAVVFRARHLRLNRTVALKMTLSGGYAGPHERERFQREAEAVAALRHPNVVQIHDVGDSDGRPYFTMEYVEGGSLAQKLAGAPLPVKEAATLAATLAEAVHTAHHKGIVHRDLKPANVLLTTDGIPKISDFGLARKGGDAGLTRTGTALGTPSYMAPEQARGQTEAIGPAADIYALGAILYEMLTGRPPFRAESAAATVLQVISQDPVPPSRLNGKVPRDLETICLKCLEKDPRRRYASATALVDDLQRFVRNEPVLARPIGHVQRFLRWIRRRPMAAVLLSTAIALSGLALGGGFWLVQERAGQRMQLRDDVHSAVDQATSLRKGFHFDDAQKMLDRASELLGSAGHDELRQQVRQARDDFELVKKLDNARLRGSTLVDRRYAPKSAEPLYAAAFTEAGLGKQGDDSEQVAARVRRSGVSADIVAALDDWATITDVEDRRPWLLEVARAAEPNSPLNALRHSEVWNNGPALQKLVEDLQPELSPQLAMAMSRVVHKAGGDAIPLLKTAQARFPNDFWLNFSLGWAYTDAGKTGLAMEYFRAAQALRPNSSPVHTAMGTILRDSKDRLEEAFDHFKRAIEIDPDFGMAHNNFAMVLDQNDRLDEAIQQFKEAIRVDPETSDKAHCSLGQTLRKLGKHAEAIEHFEVAFRGDKQASALAHTNFASLLRDEGRLDDAIGHYREAIRIDPQVWSFTYYWLGNALRDKGQPEQAIEILKRCIEVDPNLTQAWPALGMALYEAACAAVREATSQGPMDTQVADSWRAEKRQKALTWLRANLDLRNKAINEHKGVVWYVSTWQTDPALASMRDAQALAKLPDSERAQWQRLWADIATFVAASGPADGPTFASFGEWSKAAEWYAQQLKRTPTNHGHFWFEYAAVLLLAGDRPAYETACAFLLDNCEKKDGPRPYHMARACTLAPNAVAEPTRVALLAEKEFGANSRDYWSLTERGALAYRAGKYQDAIALFEKSLQSDSKLGRRVVNWLWLALAQHRLGKSDEAKRWMTKAVVWLDSYHDTMPANADEDLGLHLHNWLEAQVLRREAETLIPAKEKH